MNLQIKRDLVGADWNELANLYWEGMVGEMLGIERPRDAAWEKFTEENRRELQGSDRICMAYIDGQCVGAVHALSDGVRDAAIFGLVVHPKFRRRGIATRLVKELLAELGQVSIMLCPNDNSECVFRKFGFRSLKHAMALRYHESEYAEKSAAKISSDADELFSKASRYGGMTQSPEMWGPGGLELAEAIADAMNLPTGSLVIDLGAGSGETSCFLAEQYGWRVIAIEHWDGLPAVRRIQQKATSRKLSGQVIAMNGDARNLLLADGCVDGVFCQGTFEMIGDERRIAMEQMKRVVRPGGVIGIGEPMWNMEPPAEIVRDIYGNPTGREFLNCFRTLQWNADLLIDCGLRVVYRAMSPCGGRWWSDYYASWIGNDGKARRPDQQEEIDIWTKDRGTYQGIGIITAEVPTIV